MKKTLILSLILSVNILSAQLTYVPDDNFEQTLILLGYDDVMDDYVLTANINGITSLDIHYRGISDLTGIEDFTTLTELNCSHNELTYLDFSQNTSLIELNCLNNNLTHLDILQLTALQELRCGSNQLTYLDVSQNSVISYLNCMFNQLNTINFSQNIALSFLQCQSNNLTHLDASQIPAISAIGLHSNQLTSLDFSQNMALTELDCSNNQLTNLDISQNTSLAFFSCRDNQLTYLDFSQNTSLIQFNCANNHLLHLDIRNGNNENINYFNADHNPELNCIFVDDVVWSSENWTQIDPNSTFVETEAECDALGIDDEIFINNIQVYPNPTNKKLNFRFTGNIEIKEAVLNSYLGNTIIRTEKNFMDVSKLNNGIYIVRIITEDNKVISKKIIIGDE